MPTTTQGRRPPVKNQRIVGQEDQETEGIGRSAGLKAGLAGSLGLAVLLLISLVPIPLRACLVIPGFFVVWVGTGMLSGVLAEDQIHTRRQATGNGALAGVVAGIGGGIAAMVIAAFGVMFPELGGGVLAQFSPAQIETLAQIGVTSEVIRLGGSILSSLLFCGVGGTAVSAALAALGGRIYFRLRQA
jgi:hypothetical protein